MGLLSATYPRGHGSHSLVDTGHAACSLGKVLSGTIGCVLDNSSKTIISSLGGPHCTLRLSLGHAPTVH